MVEEEVLALFRQAMTHDDAAAMRAGVERLFGIPAHSGEAADVAHLSAEGEYRVRHRDYVMEMPQSKERIRGRDAMLSMQQTYPVPPQLTLRRVFGSGRVWVIEGTNDYQGEVWSVVAVFELDEQGLILRDTRYYGPRSDPAEWRSQWVEPME